MWFQDIGHLVKDSFRGRVRFSVGGLALILALASAAYAKSYKDYRILLRYFFGGEHYGYQIHAYDPTTGQVKVLAPSMSSNRPTPLPDGDIIYHFRSGRLDTLMIMDKDGKGHRRFDALDWRTNKNVVTCDKQVVSPDGKWVAFMQRYTGRSEAICIMGTDGQGFRVLIKSKGRPDELTRRGRRREWNPPEDYIHPVLSWSSDSRRIAYARGPWEKLNIYTININDTSIRELTNDDNNNFEPEWSPNGKVIAYKTGEDDSGDLWVMSAAGRNKRRLTKGYDNFWPRWSPDSKYIAFITEQENGLWDICLVKPDGTGFRALTRTEKQSEGYPAWSPDGKKIAYVRGKQDKRELCLMNPDGSGQEVISRAGLFDSFYRPVWTKR